ncbi:hypothetical protein GVAV_003121 [Gurleya vavrai]
MVVENRQRRSVKKAIDKTKNSKHLHNYITVLQLYKIPPQKTFSHISIILFNVLHTIINITLLAVFLIKSVGYHWYTHLLYLGFLLIAAYGGGFIFLRYFKKETFDFYAYTITLTVSYGPFFKVFYVILNRFVGHNVGFFICGTIELFITYYMFNQSLVTEESACTPRNKVITSITIFIVEVLCVMLSYLPFFYLVIFPKDA